MIKIENTSVYGFEEAIRGARNPMNSWEKSDSLFNVRVYCNQKTWETGFGGYNILGLFCKTETATSDFILGPNDLNLLTSLNKGGPEESKYRRMIVVYSDIIAPLYWWKEFDTYKVGTVANSTSTMHKIMAKEFEIGDFSTEHLTNFPKYIKRCILPNPNTEMDSMIKTLNAFRTAYLNCEDPVVKKNIWWQVVQLLPSSYNYRRTVMINYEVLSNVYRQRQHHKLDEWRKFCSWIMTLPYPELIVPDTNLGVLNDEIRKATREDTEAILSSLTEEE